jgi:hypothetical protein
MKKHLLLAAAAVSLLATTQSNATPVGAPMDFTISTVFGGAVDGTGSGGGTGVFDMSGLLTLESVQDFIFPTLGLDASVVYTTLLNGLISGTTWNTAGSGTSTINSCTGSAVLCAGFFPVGTVPIVPQVSSLDIFTGGDWTIVGGGAITTTSSARLAPQDVPAPPTTWLFGLAMLGLAGLGWKRAEVRDDRQSNWGW